MPFNDLVYVDIPLTDRVRSAIEKDWGLRLDGPAERLHGGEESAAHRVGDLVVRLGPTWRSTDEAEWCHAVAEHAAATLPEAVAPLRTPAGASVVRVDDRPVSLWRLVEGEWPDAAQPSVREQAARLLARLHRSLAAYRPAPRPVTSFAEIGLDGAPPSDVPDLADPELDRWLAAFHHGGPAHQLVHGDFYEGNTLVRDGRLVAVLDWDEVFLAPPELELASAALEWTEGLGDLIEQCRLFIADYHREGGTAAPMTDETIAQLIRHKVRREVAYYELARSRGTEHDAEDIEYNEARIKTFFELKPS